MAEIPILQISNSTNSDEKIKAIIKNLAGRGQSRPRKVKTLANTINSLFAENINEQDLLSLVKSLQDQKFITVNNGNVSYKLQ